MDGWMDGWVCRDGWRFLGGCRRVRRGQSGAAVSIPSADSRHTQLTHTHAQHTRIQTRDKPKQSGSSSDASDDPLAYERRLEADLERSYEEYVERKGDRCVLWEARLVGGLVMDVLGAVWSGITLLAPEKKTVIVSTKPGPPPRARSTTGWARAASCRTRTRTRRRSSR